VLFVIEKGTLKCEISKGGVQTHIKDYVPGEAFGELALLYNAPRAATITATTDAMLYSLDRNTFNVIVKGGAQKKKEGYEAIFKKVEILSNLDNYERTSLADAVRESRYESNKYILKQGEVGDKFFIITDGHA
jgi:cAMP-dependent protein kinase regulator